jgi:polyisoprenoid-binding protein YceI
MRFRLLLTVLVLCAGARGQEILLDSDPAHTSVRFTLPATLHTVHGSFKLSRSAIRFDPATGKIGGELVVDATSGASGDEGRDRRMHKDILESGRYPEIVFAPDRVDGKMAPEGVSQIQVHGVFRIRGAAHEIIVPVEVRMAGGKAVASAHFTIPYVKWGMKNPSTFFLRVGDHVEIDVAIDAAIDAGRGALP